MAAEWKMCLYEMIIEIVCYIIIYIYNFTSNIINDNGTYCILIP